MNTPVYIQGSGIVSPQNSVNMQTLPDEIGEFSSNHLRCIEPNAKGFISPIAVRRMSSVIKRAIVAAKICIAESNIEKPDAIISGTGLGCMEDTEKFLKAMIDNKEKFLQPTAFIQSTHNTVSSQIAIALKCHGYNSTYVNRGFSFESSLLDGMMLIEDKQAKNVMIGSYDEMTPSYYQLLSRIDYWKKEQLKNTELLNHSNSKGTIAGEGCVYFMLSSEKKKQSYAKLLDMEMIYKPASSGDLQNQIASFLKRNEIKRSEIDLLISGINGDSNLDAGYQEVHKSFDTDIAYYKHLSGDYYTASSFGLWAGTQILKNHKVPDYMYLRKKGDQQNISTILLFNNYRGANLSLILLRSC